MKYVNLDKDNIKHVVGFYEIKIIINLNKYIVYFISYDMFEA